MFLDLMFYGIDTEIKSLRLISAKAKERHSIQLSKQGLDDRFSQASIDFAKSLLDEAMASQVTTSLAADELHLFKRVRIKDSTAFGVHDSLSAYFEGYGKGGGKSSKAAIGIQYEFDIKSHRVLDIDLHSAVKNDSKDAVEKKDDIQKGDLIIRDLGYYSDQVIDEVQKKEAFFLSRLYSNSIVWVDEHSDKRLDFQALYCSMQQTQCTSMEMNVYVGKMRRRLRLIVELMPETVYEKRMNKRKKQVKVSGSTITNEFKIRSRFNLFVCNIPAEECPLETISKLYRTRWQIELIFKIWKSILQIDQIRKMKKERFMTTMYLKLSWIFLNWNIISETRNVLYATSGKLLSMTKCFQSMVERNELLRSGLTNNKIDEIILRFVVLFENNHWVERRKNRMNFEEYISVLFCKSTI